MKSEESVSKNWEAFLKKYSCVLFNLSVVFFKSTAVSKKTRRFLQKFSDDGRKQVGEPSTEALPWGAEGFPVVGGKQETVVFFVVEEVVELFGCLFVDDYRIGLVVPAKAA